MKTPNLEVRDISLYLGEREVTLYPEQMTDDALVLEDLIADASQHGDLVTQDVLEQVAQHPSSLWPLTWNLGSRGREIMVIGAPGDDGVFAVTHAGGRNRSESAVLPLNGCLRYLRVAIIKRK